VWYELAYIESLKGVAHGQRVWQLAFGSGFKFNSAVLVATRRIQDVHPAWEDFNPQVGVWCMGGGAGRVEGSLGSVTCLTICPCAVNMRHFTSQAMWEDLDKLEAEAAAGRAAKTAGKAGGKQ
jgi:hypothetical protein